MAETDDDRLEEWFETAGIHGMFEQVIDAGMTRAIQMILSKRRSGELSDDVETFCEEAQARAFLGLGENRFPRMGSDDRFADNSEICLGLFDLSIRTILPDSMAPAQQLMKRFELLLQRDENRTVPDLLVRLPSEYFKLLVYYGHARSFADVREFLKGYAEHYGEPSECGGGCFDGPVDRFSDLDPGRLDKILQRANLKDSKAFGSLVYHPGFRAYLQNVDEEFNAYLCGRILYPSDSDFLQSVLAVGSMIEGDVLTDAAGKRQYVQVEKDSLRNIATVAGYLHISAFKDLDRLLRSPDLTNALRSISNPNLNVILDVTQPRNVRELLDIAEHTKLNSNARYTNFAPLAEMLDELEVAGRDAKKVAIRVFSSVYCTEMQQCCTTISERLRHFTEAGVLTQEDKGAHREFIVSLLEDPMYATQNLDVMAGLLGDRTLGGIEIERLQELRGQMQGFLTPVLADRYISLSEESDRHELLERYRIRMREVLGSGPIAIDDPELVAEIIYLAYRPRGFAMRQIATDISWGRVQDFSSHLDRLSVEVNGYPFQFESTERRQASQFDIDLLHSVEIRIFRKPTEDVEDIVKGALSKKKAFEGCDDKLFARVLTGLGDYRVQAYIEEYKQGKTYSDAFSEERLEALAEILRIIPNEPEFLQALHRTISTDGEVLKAATEAVEQYLWQARKEKASPEEREVANLLRKLILRFQGSYGGENATVLGGAERLLLQKLALQVEGKEPEQVLEDLRRVKWQRLLGEEYSPATVVSVFGDLMKTIAGRHLRAVTAEQRKAEALLTGEKVEGRAYLSKNVGSFYAKAGAELCTALDFGMWEEARHLHLNFAINDQVVGNIMLYFEPGRDYLVARGFNPRNDTLLKFDRRSIAEEMVRIVKEIGWANGYKEVFITEQGAWHALSNREGIAKEVLDIARESQTRILAEIPNQRVEIEDAHFFVREEDGSVICDRLILLAARTDA